jgi:hypothetical protein
MWIQFREHLFDRSVNQTFSVGFLRVDIILADELKSSGEKAETRRELLTGVIRTSGSKDFSSNQEVQAD